MIYGPDDKPIVPAYARAVNNTLEKWYNRTTLEALQKKFRFTDWWGPTLYDARGNQIEWPGRPMVPVKTGRTIQFFRKMEPVDVAVEAAEALGYRAGETKDVPLVDQVYNDRRDNIEMQISVPFKQGQKQGHSGFDGSQNGSYPTEK